MAVRASLTPERSHRQPAPAAHDPAEPPQHNAPLRVQLHIIEGPGAVGAHALQVVHHPQAVPAPVHRPQHQARLQRSLDFVRRRQLGRACRVAAIRGHGGRPAGAARSGAEQLAGVLGEGNGVCLAACMEGQAHSSERPSAAAQVGTGQPSRTCSGRQHHAATHGPPPASTPPSTRPCPTLHAPTVGIMRRLVAVSPSGPPSMLLWLCQSYSSTCQSRYA